MYEELAMPKEDSCFDGTETVHRQDNSPTHILETVHRQNWRQFTDKYIISYVLM